MEEESVEEECISLDDEADDEGGNLLAGLSDKLSNLNSTQELAARSFLDSLKESLHIIQGPPGTGKSTFLVNVICRRLATDPKGRILVTAPTNRAVLVLAERFLAVTSCGDRIFQQSVTQYWLALKTSSYQTAMMDVSHPNLL